MKYPPSVPVCENEIDFVARDLIAQHGPDAAVVATEYLNEMIDNGNWQGRDAWASVVHSIHDHRRLRSVDTAVVSSARLISQLAAMGR